MILGVNSVLFGGFPMESAFQYVKAAGYDGIEISAIEGMSEHLVLERWKESAQLARRFSKQYDLPILAIEQPLPNAALMESAFQSAVEMNCPIVNCGPGGRSDDEASFGQVVDTLGRLADMAGKYEVLLCVKAHVGQAIYNTQTSVRLLNAIDHRHLGLDMDPSHLHRAGEDPVKAISAVFGRIRHIHIRDCKGRGPDPGSPALQVNGRGDIDLLGYLRVLHQMGYAGPVDLEIIGAKELELPFCVAIAAESRGHMQAALQACGAR